MLNKLTNLSKSALYLSFYRLKDSLNRNVKLKEETIAGYIDEIREKGFVVIEGYYDESQCKALREEIDRMIVDYREKIWMDAEEADHRIYGAERVSDVAKKYHEDPFLRDMTRSFHQSECNFYFTLAAKIRATNKNLGSGGGWHRDSVHMKQFKSLTYLTDVDEDHGPFQYLVGTQKESSIFDTIQHCGIEFGQNRFTPEEIDRIMDTGKYKLETLTGKAGTLVLVDTFGIHRGKPIRSGERYAITNYFYASHLFGEKLRNKFANTLVDRPD